MHTSSSVRTVFVAMSSLALLAGCSSHVEMSAKDSSGALKVAFGDEAARKAPVGPNDVRITSKDGVLVLSLVGDEVRMQLSDSLRSAVGASIDAKDYSSDGMEGLGKIMAKAVSDVVTGAMGFVVRVPVADVENLRFDDGHIRFDIRNSDGHVNIDSDTRRNAVFSEKDARRFIDAVNARSTAS